MSSSGSTDTVAAASPSPPSLSASSTPSQTVTLATTIAPPPPPPATASARATQSLLERTWSALSPSLSSPPPPPLSAAAVSSLDAAWSKTRPAAHDSSSASSSSSSSWSSSRHRAGAAAATAVTFTPSFEVHEGSERAGVVHVHCLTENFDDYNAWMPGLITFDGSFEERVPMRAQFRCVRAHLPQVIDCLLQHGYVQRQVTLMARM